MSSKGALPSPAGFQNSGPPAISRRFTLKRLLIFFLSLFLCSIFVPIFFLENVPSAPDQRAVSVQSAGNQNAPAEKPVDADNLPVGLNGPEGALLPVAPAAPEAPLSDPSEEYLPSPEPKPSSEHSSPPVPTPAAAPGAVDFSKADEAAVPRAAAVREAFRHGLTAYLDNCFGQDEFHPVSRHCSDWLGAGLTMLDSLPTALIMGGFDVEVARVRDWVKNSLNFAQVRTTTSFFETVIRILGGLLSIYDLTKDSLYLDRARDLGDRLLVCFDTPTGLPKGQVNIGGGHCSEIGWTGGSSLLAEVGTCQLEFAYLSKATGDPKYFDRVQRIVDHLDHMKKPMDGLYPLYISPHSGQFTNQKISFGAMGDSAYEYFLKFWLLTGRKQEQYKRMYRESMRGMFDHLYVENPQGQTYVAEFDYGQKLHKQDHLACFVPGMLALGAKTGAVEGAEAEKHLKAAKALMETCVETYRFTASGIGPEYVNFNPQMSVGEPSYNLRPETMESLFVLYRVTGDEKYRHQGWEIFQSVERHCRLPIGYTGLRNVNNPQDKLDKMESFFLAEFLKYAYLLFSPIEKIPIFPIGEGEGGNNNQGKFYVFNTECHPLRNWE